MYKSGRFVANHIDPVDPSQIQPNGVDLTLDAIFEPIGRGRIGQEGKTIADRRELTPDSSNGSEYHLDTGGYIVRYGEQVSIPTDHIGFIYPRSSLMRNGTMVNTAVWDAGYEGRGEGLLEVNQPITLESGARIAQLVLADADHDATYDGAYQQENL